MRQAHGAQLVYDVLGRSNLQRVNDLIVYIFTLNIPETTSVHASEKSFDEDHLYLTINVDQWTCSLCNPHRSFHPITPVCNSTVSVPSLETATPTSDVVRQYHCYRCFLLSFPSFLLSPRFSHSLCCHRCLSTCQNPETTHSS